MINQIAENLGLEKCNFNDECDTCQAASNGTWAKRYCEPEGVTEVEYYICGGCLAMAALQPPVVKLF